MTPASALGIEKLVKTACCCFFDELAAAVEFHIVHLILRYCSYQKNLDLTHINDIYWVFFFLQ